MHGVLVAVLGDAHEGVFFDLLLGQISRDAALLRPRHAHDQRPVDLARRAGAEGFRQCGGGKARLGDQQAAGGVLVEPVHQARALGVGARAAQGAEHAVDVADGAGAALHGKPHGLIKHQHVGVLVERDRFEEGAVLLRRRRVVARGRRVQLERRYAHGLSRFQPRLRLRALAVHAHLAFADDALDMAEREPGKARLEEAVYAHIVFVRGDGDGLHAGRIIRGLRSDHRRGHNSRPLLTRRAGGISAASAAITLRCVLRAQIGLPRIGALFSPLLDPLVAIATLTATLTAAARPGLLPSAAWLARSVASAGHAGASASRESAASRPSRPASLISNRSASASRNSRASSMHFSLPPLSLCTDRALLKRA